MKTLVLTATTIFFCLTVLSWDIKSQTAVGFGYDDRGNRIIRDPGLANKKGDFTEQVISELDGYLVYPNPATNTLNIETPVADTGLYTIQLVNPLGQPVFLEADVSKGHLKTIDLQKIPAGAYYLLLVAGEKRNTLTVIKQ